MKTQLIINRLSLAFFAVWFMKAGFVQAQPDSGPELKGLTKDELIAKMERVLESKQQIADGLGKVIQNFETADANHNGLLSREEFRTYAEANGIKMPHPRKGRHHRKELTKEQLIKMRDHITAKEGQAPAGLDSIIENFTAADANHDGVLSREESKAYADANGIKLPYPHRRGHGPNF